MINNINFNINTLQQLASDVNKRQTISRKKDDIASNQYIPSIFGQIKFAPSRQFIHYKTDEKNGTKTQVLGTYINIPNFISTILTNWLVDVNSYNIVGRQIDPEKFGLYIIPPWKDNGFETYVNDDSSTTSYKDGKQIYVDSTTIKTAPGLELDPVLVDDNSSWLELPYPADDIGQIGVSLFTNFYTCVNNNERELKFELVIYDPGRPETLQVTKDLIGFNCYAAIVTSVVDPRYSTHELKNGDIVSKNYPIGNPLLSPHTQNISIINTLPIINLYYNHKNYYNLQCIFPRTRELNDDFYYGSSNNAPGMFLVHLMPKADSFVQTFLADAGSWGGNLAYQTAAVDLQDGQYVDSWNGQFWSYISSTLKRPIIIFMTFPHIVNGNTSTHPYTDIPDDALQSLYSIFGEPIGEIKELKDSNYSQYIISLVNHPIPAGTDANVDGDLDQAFFNVISRVNFWPPQENRDIYEIVQSLIGNIPNVDTLYSPLSSINWNERDGDIGDLQIYKFNDSEYHYTKPAGTYNNNYELIIRDNTSNAKVNYLNITDLWKDAVDTIQSGGNQRSIDYNDSLKALQLYNFDKAADIPNFNETGSPGYDFVIRCTSNDSRVRYITLQNLVDDLKDRLGINGLGNQLENITINIGDLENNTEHLLALIQAVSDRCGILEEKCDEETGDFWIRGGGSQVNYGTAIGDVAGNTVFDLAQRRTMSDWENQGSLHVNPANSGSFRVAQLFEVETGNNTSTINTTTHTVASQNTTFQNHNVFFNNGFYCTDSAGVETFDFEPVNVTLRSANVNSNATILCTNGQDMVQWFEDVYETTDRLLGVMFQQTEMISQLNDNINTLTERIEALEEQVNNQ